MRSFATRARAALLLSAAALAATGGQAPAHVHHVDNPSHSQNLANDQNHAPFVFNSATGQYESCGTVDPAGYGLETAHHGADQGIAGAADGCFALSTAPAVTDNNPAID